MKRTEIRELLALRGWSQGELARQLGVEPSTVSRWFTTRDVPTPVSILLRHWLTEARAEDRKQPA